MQTNNKMREALTKILNLTNSLDEDCAVDPVEIRDIAKAALAAPATAEKSSAVGNMAAMREALEATLKLFWDIHNANRSPQSNRAYAVIRKIKAALAAPPRNCDVGTEQEQAERYVRYCDIFTRDGMHCETCPCCGKIPFGKCEFAWAQLPYVEKEGGNK